MSDILDTDQIIATILKFPENKGLRDVACQITHIVFDVRRGHLFPEFSDEEKIEEASRPFYTLLESFRNQIRDLTKKDVQLSDDELYSQIVLPIVTRLIDRSA